MPDSRFRTCKQCGNRNHPRSGLCQWCGAHLHVPMGWFSTTCLIVMAAVLAGIVAYAICNRTPSPQFRELPDSGGLVEE